MKEEKDFEIKVGLLILLFQQEQLLGRALTVAEKAKLKDGVYEISTKNGLKYLGWYDSEMKDGVYAFKSNDGVYSVEAFRNHWRTHYKEITKSEFEEITKGKQAI